MASISFAIFALKLCWFLYGSAFIIKSPQKSSFFRVFGKSKALAKAQFQRSYREDLPSMFHGEMDNCDESMNLFGQMFKEELGKIKSPPEVGDFVTGTILSFDEKGAIVDIGAKCTAYIPTKEISLQPVKNISSYFEVGQSVSGEILGLLRGTPIVSLRSALLEKAWNEVHQLAKDNCVFNITIVEVNEGGLIGDFRGLQCFLPGSQMIGAIDSSLLKHQLSVKVLDFDEEEGRLIVSQRKSMTSDMPSLKVGNVVSCIVTGLRQYGVFLEVSNGMTGLLHLSQISHDHVDDLAGLFRIGQQIKAMVLEVEPFSNRLALSTKVLEKVSGDMLKNMTQVFNSAEETAKLYMIRLEAAALSKNSVSNSKLDAP